MNKETERLEKAESPEKPEEEEIKLEEFREYNLCCPHCSSNYMRALDVNVYVEDINIKTSEHKGADCINIKQGIGVVTGYDNYEDREIIENEKPSISIEKIVNEAGETFPVSDSVNIQYLCEGCAKKSRLYLRNSSLGRLLIGWGEVGRGWKA